MLLGLALAVSAGSVFAQTIKIGFITSYSGLNGNLGPYMERAVRLYIKEHEKELPPGVKIELITRDDTGPNPDKAKQLAQELIVRDKVHMLAGVIFTPNAMAIAPLATEAKVPFVIMNAGTAVITTRSPYIARTSFTLWQSSFPLGTWAAKKYKTAYTLVSDFGPGHDAETAFTQAFKAGGGNVRRQRARAAAEPGLGGVHAARQGRQARRADGVHPGGQDRDRGDEELLRPRPRQGRHQADRPGRHHHRGRAAEHGRRGARRHHRVPLVRGAATGPANKAFVAAWKKEYGANETPNFLSVGSWDGMALIFDAIKQQKGKLDPDRTMEIFKAHKNPNSPRGPISIDPETRDIIQPEYLREVRKVGGQLANVELETLGTAVKDPWKELQKSAAAEEVEPHPGRASSVCRKRRLPRRRLRHDPVRHFRRPVGDDGPDGLRQPRPRRVRHGRRLHPLHGDGAPRHAVPARAADRRVLGCRWQVVVLERLLYSRLYAAGELAQVLFSIGLIFASMAVARLLYGDRAVPVFLPEYLRGQLHLLGRDFPTYRVFLIVF